MNNAQQAQSNARPQAQGHSPSQGPAHSQQRGTAQNHQPAADTCLQDPSLITTAVTYSQADLDALIYMIEEEKFAGDIYDAFYEQTGLRVFDKIGDAEDQHLATLIAQAEIAGLNLDTVLSLPEGSYSNPELQSLYDTLLATGSVSTTAALEVGVAIELTDIADLDLAVVDLVGTPLGTAYVNLLSGSNNHLAAFESLM
jgi:hypothetical protein